MQNKVFINPQDVIEIIYYGVQSTQSVKQVVEKTVQLAEELRQQSKPVFLLSDVTDIKKSNPEARRAAADALKMGVYDKAAIVGNKNPLFKHVTNLVILATGMGKKAKYFNSKKEAESWLGL